MVKRLKIGRTSLGFGDWIMLARIMRMLNKYNPNVEIDLIANTFVPLQFTLLPHLCGARCALVGPHGACHYDWVCAHVVYAVPRPTLPVHLCEAMLENLNQSCPGLNATYDASMLAVPLYVAPVDVPSTKYVVMSSCGATGPGRLSSALKEWPYMLQLAARLSRDYEIVQVGYETDPLIPQAKYRFMNTAYPSLSYVYSHAAFAVSLENGLSHWAGQHGTRCYTIFTSKFHAKPEHVWYPAQISIGVGDGTIPSLNLVYDTIVQNEKAVGSNMITVI